MQTPLRPANEQLRLEVLRDYDVLDTLPEQALDDITTLAAHICEAPIARISLIDENRQWFLSKVGNQDCETSRDISFCGHAILDSGLLIIPDAAADEWFADNPMVTGEPYVRFYAGAPLVTQDGFALGALCVVDRVPRALKESQKEALRVLSRQVIAQFDLRRKSQELANREQLLRTIYDSEPECVKLLGQDGSLQMINRAGLKMVEAESFNQIAGQCVYPMVSEKYRAEYMALIGKVFRGESGKMEFQFTGLKGSELWLETHAAPLRDGKGDIISLLGITRDITERKKNRDGAAKEKGAPANGVERGADGDFRLGYRQ